MNYYSPELVSYIQGSAAAGDLTEASDIFALGLIYAEYLTGALPAFDPAHHEAAIAVLNGAAAPARRRERAGPGRRAGGADAAGRPRRPARPSPRSTRR